MGCAEVLFSTPKLDVIETPEVIAQPIRNRHSIHLRVSALSSADVDAVVQDLDNMCTEVVHTHVIDANKYGETISRLTDTQVLFGVVQSCCSLCNHDVCCCNSVCLCTHL